MTCANPNVCVNPNARERTVNGGLEGSFGGRPPDAVAGDDVNGTREAQGKILAQGGSNSIPPFKETLVGNRESHDVVEDRVEPQSIENNEVRAISREVQVANTVRSSGVSVSTSEVVATQRKQHVARGKMVGVAVDTEKVLVGHVNPAKIFDNRGVHIGGVKNVASHETVVKAASTLNSEKHVAVRVCMWRRNG
ncbi:hypothetical protein V6N12_003130 [Hibiscus sabdariffa]|uniref:Uncharacterized protein n=1 Tax=Hibiscus sabdariffa TaxID=183260 RepID=A0ABR2ECH1_9ROSI